MKEVLGGHMEHLKVTITADLLNEAQRILGQHEEGLEKAVNIPSGAGGEINAILSPNAADMIPLKEISHNGKIYYLGIPKS